jgi:hypothetical protein
MTDGRQRGYPGQALAAKSTAAQRGLAMHRWCGVSFDEGRNPYALTKASGMAVIGLSSGKLANF